MTQKTFKKSSNICNFWQKGEKWHTIQQNPSSLGRMMHNNVRNYPIPHTITSPPIWQFWTSHFMEILLSNAIIFQPPPLWRWHNMWMVPNIALGEFWLLWMNNNDVMYAKYPPYLPSLAAPRPPITEQLVFKSKCQLQKLLGDSDDQPSLKIFEDLNCCAKMCNNLEFSYNSFDFWFIVQFWLWITGLKGFVLVHFYKKNRTFL